MWQLLRRARIDRRSSRSMKLEDPKPRRMRGSEASQTKESKDMRQESMPASFWSVLAGRHGRLSFAQEIVVTH